MAPEDERPEAHADGAPDVSELKNFGYELFVGLLSILSIVNMLLVVVVRDENLKQVLRLMNVLFSVVFVLDFTYRLVTAPDRAGYVFRQFGWADFLASLPFAQLKILRLFRVIRVVRLFRQVGLRQLRRRLIDDLAGSALLTLLFIGVLVLEFGSLGMLAIERYGADANIKTASDAMWFMIVTMSTVGYGDRYPVTNPGRVLGAVIIVIGVGIFGTLTGYLANAFVSVRKRGGPESATAAEAHVEQLKALLAQQQAALDELAEQLATDGG